MNVDKNTSIRLRVQLIGAPPGVTFAVQRGSDELLPPTQLRSDGMQFDFTLRFGAQLADGGYNFLGEFAQGTPTDRFVYINCGTAARQCDSPWSRRAKLKLAGIPREMVAAVIEDSKRVIEARVRGTGKDGTPVCATVKPDWVSWHLLPA